MVSPAEFESQMAGHLFLILPIGFLLGDQTDEIAGYGYSQPAAR